MTLNDATTQNCWRLHDGTVSPLLAGDEVDVESNIPGLRHRGLIYDLVDQDFPLVVHANKGTNVTMDEFQRFSQGRNVRLLRRPESPAHAELIIYRANVAIQAGVNYHALFANCEHFTEYCFSGNPRSPTVGGLAVLGIGALVFVALTSDPAAPVRF